MFPDFYKKKKKFMIIATMWMFLGCTKLKWATYFRGLCMLNMKGLFGLQWTVIWQKKNSVICVVQYKETDTGFIYRLEV